MKLYGIGARPDVQMAEVARVAGRGRVWSIVRELR
jgi:hypothetical protein